MSLYFNEALYVEPQAGLGVDPTGMIRENSEFGNISSVLASETMLIIDEAHAFPRYPRNGAVDTCFIYPNAHDVFALISSTALLMGWSTS